MTTAPVCPVSRSQPAPVSVAAQVNSIPYAHDLPSAITTINKINNLITQLTVGQPQINNVYPPKLIPQPTSQLAAPVWNEMQRTYANGVIINPDNPLQRISVKTIAQLNWFDSSSGQYLIYNNG